MDTDVIRGCADDDDECLDGDDVGIGDDGVVSAVVVGGNDSVAIEGEEEDDSNEVGVGGTRS